MEPEDEEAICPLEEVPIMKKRRKKQKKVVDTEFSLLPEESVDGLSSEILDELNTAYKIFQIIMGISKIEPFLDKPNENLFGMSSYYSIIKKPMWLYEVRRKLLNKEYEGIGVFVSDIRLILENCYRFWGPTHKFSRKALYIEHKLELQLTQLPDSMREKCFDPELNASEIIFKTENLDDGYSCDNEEPVEKVKDSVAVTLLKGFESKILNRVLEDDEPHDTDDIEEQNRKEAEMLIWEREHLVSDTHKKQIESMWQLAEIGSFLKLTFGVFNIEEISQYEVERMFLMPKESTTLATLMTSMLSPQVLRSQLDDKPVMPYEIWTFRLKRRIDHWLSVFYTSNDETEAFYKCGVDTQFWSIVNLMNPLEDNSFHEISFFQRVWIFKSLCDDLLHSDKGIQDIFLDSANVKELRPIRIGGDRKGNIYFRIPFFQEIRVYRQTTLPESVFQTLDKNTDDFHAESLEKTNQINFNEEENELEVLPSETDCKIIADSVDSLKAYIKVLRDSKQQTLAKHFSQQLKLVKNERRSIEGLMALYTQWHDYQNRSQEYFSHILSLWLSKEKPAHAQSFLQLTNEKDDTTAEVEVLGKRRVKPNQNFEYLDLKSSDDSGEQSGDLETSDGSDWERTYRHKKKKKVERKRRRKRASSESKSENSEDLCNSDLNIQEVISIQEELHDIKPDIRQMDIKIENGNMDIETDAIQQFDSAPIVAPPPHNINVAGSDSNQLPKISNSLSYSPSLAVNSIPEVPIIKLEKDDIICISSDEELDPEVKTPETNTVPNKMKNGIPLSNPVPLPGATVTVRAPSPALPRPSPPLALARPPPPLAIAKPPPLQALPRALPPPLVARTRTVPQPIIPMPQPIPAPSLPRTAQMPLPIPIPPTTRQMPLPIPEPTMPQPIVEPPMPQPMPQTPTRNWSSPRNSTTSPRARGISPRLRSPLPSPVMRTPSPRSMAMRPKISPVRSPRNPAVRNLFPQTTAPPSNAVPTVEGVLEIGQKPDGSYGYHVKLPDGGIINMSRLEIDEIRRKNNGVLPVKVEVPLTKNKKF